jgi:glutamine synthetase
LYDEAAKLETALSEAQEVEDVVAQAKSYFEKVRPGMDAVRFRVDALEKLVAKSFWPLPGYEEMLFKL